MSQALDLLPANNGEVEFDAYKAQLYSQLPNNGRDVFAHMIKRDLVQKKLSRDSNGKIIVLLSRKAGK